jgi:hypothetical protein
MDPVKPVDALDDQNKKIQEDWDVYWSGKDKPGNTVIRRDCPFLPQVYHL